ncbi:MAG: SIMPL domain-containing protein [candidate division Zixibacteria bacterium]|nr:SIMPL domain-containing protein [candidate division Zixibacteria bacterium]
MKTITKRAAIGFLLVSVFCFSAWAKDQSESRLITVTGEAEVRVVPDEVILTLGVETHDKNLSIAKNQNDEIVKKALAVTKKYRIQSKHVQTDYIDIEPRHKWGNYEEGDFIGYFVQKKIVVTLKDVSRFEDLFTNMLTAGVNYVHGVEFRTTELRKYRDQARALAIKAASEKASALAKELGQKVGKPHTIQEEPSWWWCWYNSWWGSRRGGGMTQNVVQNVNGVSSTGESSIALGQINVNAKVTVSFELE